MIKDMKKLITGAMIAFTSCGLLANTAMCENTEEHKQAFYAPFDVNNIPKNKMQKFPYYRYVSMHYDQFARYGTAPVTASKPLKLLKGETFDLTQEFEAGQSYIQNLTHTLTKGFVVLKDGKIAAEFYDNGYNIGMLNNLQSASKTYIGVIIHKLVDLGLIKLEKKASVYLPELSGTDIGEATVQQILDMNSGIEPLVDYHKS